MSPLGRAVYEQLRARLAQDDPKTSYAELARTLREASPDFEHLTHRSYELYAALMEVGRYCRRMRLPPLPAIVVRADTRRPGAAYYPAGVATGEAIAAWREDLEAVKRAAYLPPV